VLNSTILSIHQNSDACFHWLCITEFAIFRDPQFNLMDLLSLLDDVFHAFPYTYIRGKGGCVAACAWRDGRDEIKDRRMSEGDHQWAGGEVRTMLFDAVDVSIAEQLKDILDLNGLVASWVSITIAACEN